MRNDVAAVQITLQELKECRNSEKSNERRKRRFRMSESTTDYDSPWKEAIERYFHAFMALFFPLAHADID